MGSLAPACLGGGGGSNSKPAATPPLAPNTLVADPDPTTARIDLTWIDAADNEFEFRIERSDDGVNYTQVGTVPKNIQGYTDLGLQANTIYFYRVAAWNAKGYSAFAGPVSRKTMGLSWTPGSMTGGPGIGKAHHSAVYDNAGKRMIVFGGIDDGLTILNDVWSYNLTAATAGDWTQVSPNGTPPLPRWGHSAIFDPINNRMIVFGGIAEVPPVAPSIVPSFIHQNDVHILDFDSVPPVWSTPATTGTPPSARAFHTAIYDAANERMILHGGEDNLDRLDDVVVLDLTTLAWSRPALGARPVKRSEQVSIHDPVRDRMLVFGGVDNQNAGDGSLLNGESWTLDTGGNTGWSQLFFAGTPGFRAGHTGVYDAANQRMVIFGGYFNTASTTSSELWGLKLHGTPAWTILDPTSGSPPPPRYGHTAIYDSGFQRMIIYGGYDDFATAYDEVWVIRL